jgi:hypothetical protein
MLLTSVLTETLNEGWRRFAGPSRVARYDLTPRAEKASHDRIVIEPQNLGYFFATETANNLQQ